MPRSPLSTEPGAGELRQRLAFEQRTVTNDGYGNVDGDWAVRFIVWGKCIPRKGGEQVMASRLTGVTPYTIIVRSSADMLPVDTAWRVRDARTDVIYNIRDIDNPDQKHKFIELLVTTGDAV